MYPELVPILKAVTEQILAERGGMHPAVVARMDKVSKEQTAAPDLIDESDDDFFDIELEEAGGEAGLTIDFSADAPELNPHIRQQFDSETYLPESVRIKGHLHLESNDAVIHGCISGNLTSIEPGATIILGPKAMIQGDVSATTVESYGLVCGNIIADHVVLHSLSSTQGSIFYGSNIQILDGAELVGQIRKQKKQESTGEEV